MIIKSPYRDYYDHIANQYGGGDPKIVYNRTVIGERGDDLNSGKAIYGKIVDAPPSNVYDPSDLGLSTRYTVTYLVVAGCAYLFGKKNSEDTNGIRISGYHLKIDFSDFKILDADLDPYEEYSGNVRSWRFLNRKIDWGFKPGEENQYFIELSRAVGHPVFVVLGVNHEHFHDRVMVDGVCPILTNTGIASIVSAEKMYQDIAYFVGNLMKPFPDTEPPVTVSNKEKILKAGFDLKKSFRHRV